MLPRISVIIPVLNAELFIADAVNSVLSQKYSSEMEIIVVDDGSVDNTRRVVSDMAQKYCQILLLSNKRTKGPSGARNTGLLNATGDYLAFLDADDIWLPNHLQEGVGFLDENSNIDIVFYNFEIHERETKRTMGDWFSKRRFPQTLKAEELDGKYYLIRGDMFNALLDESFIHLQSLIARRSVAYGVLFNENVKHSEDRDFSIRLYLQSKPTIAFKDLVTGIYYRYGNSLTSKSIENDLLATLAHIELFGEYISYEGLENSTVKKLKKLLFSKYMSASYYYRKLNCRRLALSCFSQSLCYHIALSHPKELAKICVSLTNHNILQLARHLTGLAVKLRIRS